MSPIKYTALKELVPKIGNALPELDVIVPCYMLGDQVNQLGAFQSSQCSLNDFEKGVNMTKNRV